MHAPTHTLSSGILLKNFIWMKKRCYCFYVPGKSAIQTRELRSRTQWLNPRVPQLGTSFWLSWMLKCIRTSNIWVETAANQDLQVLPGRDRQVLPAPWIRAHYAAFHAFSVTLFSWGHGFGLAIEAMFPEHKAVYLQVRHLSTLEHRPSFIYSHSAPPTPCALSSFHNVIIV